MTTLPLSSSAEEIAAGIIREQISARLRKANPNELAARVRAQLERVEVAAGSLGLPPAKLDPCGTFYQSDKHIEDQVTTIVRVSPYGIIIERRAPSSGEGNGSIRLRLESLK